MSVRMLVSTRSGSKTHTIDSHWRGDTVSLAKRAFQLRMRRRKDQAKSKTTDLAERLGQSYGALFRGFMWEGSEGDDPFHAFSAPFQPETKLTPETFRAAVRIRHSWKIEIELAGPWFTEMIKYFHDNEGGYDPAEAHAMEIVYTHLLEAMKATLEGPLRLASVHYAPKNESASFTFHKARYYIFGQVAEGGVAGVMAHSVET